MSLPSSSDVPSYFDKRWDGETFILIDTRLETWHDPTPRESDFTLKDLHAASVEAFRHEYSLRPRSTRPTEVEVRQREEHDRKSLAMALEIYTKQNNMQPTDFEFVEVKERNLIDEYGKGYLHFNFLVKEPDGKHTMFFAEVHHNLIDENDVYLCMPLGESDITLSKRNDQAHCKGCRYLAKDLIHPSCGGFLGGHMYVALPRFDSDDEERELNI